MELRVLDGRRLKLSIPVLISSSFVPLLFPGRRGCSPVLLLGREPNPLKVFRWCCRKTVEGIPLVELTREDNGARGFWRVQMRMSRAAQETYQ